MTGAGAMGWSPEFPLSPLPVLYGERSDCGAVRVRGEHNIKTLLLHSRKEALTPTPASAGRGRSKSRLAAGILAGLRDLQLGVGHHQSAFVRQRHELEAHIDRTHRALGAAAVNAGIETALAALLHDLLIDLQDFRL